MPVEFENDEEKKATKSVQDLLVQAKETQLIFAMLDRMVRAPKICAKAGEIKEDIYRHNCKVQDECGLSKLPAELQRWIWSYLVLPADRLMLALTCKSHAAVFEELKGNIQKKSSASKKSEKAISGPKSTARSSPVRDKPATKMDKLYVLYRLQGWLSNKYRLCYECVRFRKKIRSIRKGALTCAVKDSWSGTKFSLATEKDHDEQEIMKELKDKIKTGSRCPECCERARLATVSAKKCHKDLKELLAKTLKMVAN